VLLIAQLGIAAARYRQPNQINKPTSFFAPLKINYLLAGVGFVPVIF